MPNYVKNSITADPQTVKKITEMMRSDESSFDFNNLVKMPEDLNIKSSPMGEEGAKCLLEKSNSFLGVRFNSFPNEIGKSEEALELGRKYLINIAKYGYATWYEWRIANWGTKWLAESIDVGNDSIYFGTAWHGVGELMQKLSEKLGNVPFEYMYASENTGYECGRLLLQNGHVIIDDIPEEGSQDAYEIFFRLWPEYRKDYELVDGTYQNVDSKD